jgi:hypothetical protein
MLKKVIIILIVLILGYGLFIVSEGRLKVNKKVSDLPTPSLTSPEINSATDITASFKIITGSITRSFTNPKYHNRSSDIFIEASDPTVVHAKKVDLTWNNFFNTLPMKLTEDCLTTGDGETYCNGKDGKLEFFINGQLDRNLLSKEIKQDDSVLIKFTPN